MQLTVLGCGDAFGSHGRYHTSFLVEEHNHCILLDCGATTLVRMKQLAISTDSIDSILISHFHGDHYGGLPFFLLSCKIEAQRTKPLQIIGPKGIKEQVHTLLNAMYPESGRLLDELDILFHEFEENNWIDCYNLKVYSCPMLHSTPSKPHGYKVKWKGKTIGYSGDTEWTESLIELANETDLFVLECNNYDHETPGHLSFHTIQKHQSKINTKQLLLTHMGNEMIEQTELTIRRMKDGDHYQV